MLKRSDVENATISGDIYVNPSPSASINAPDTKIFRNYVSSQWPGTLSETNPDTLSKATWLAVQSAKELGQRVTLTDTKGQCNYPFGSYFDEITVME
jgi:hypothetical protein